MQFSVLPTSVWVRRFLSLTMVLAGISLLSYSIAYSQSEGFEVKTYKTQAPVAAREIQLITPPHLSTLTPGVVKFQWEVDSKVHVKKAKSDLIVEKIDSTSKRLIKTKKQVS